MRQRFHSAAGLAGAALAVIGAGPASAAPHGTRLTTTINTVTADEFGGNIGVSLPAYLAFYDGLRIEVQRPNYRTHITAVRTIPTTRSIDPRLLRGWNGFRKAVTIVVRDSTGKVVVKRSRDWCPNSYSPQRISTGGPDAPTFPESCSANPFTLATVWGVDKAWAVPAADFVTFRGAAGRYRASVIVAPKVAQVIGLPLDKRTITVSVVARHQQDGPPLGRPAAAPAAAAGLDLGPVPQSSPLPRPLPRTLNGLPQADTLPDIASLPAFWIGVTHEGGHDLLNFAANEWNAGPGPMVIEGFRTPGRTTMHAYQVFYRNGRPVQSLPSGTMEFHKEPEHNHWHFLDFARYDLVTRTGAFVRTSGKQSWCLAPTEPIDLARPNATVRPAVTGLTSTCGGIDAMWLRETLPVGWGDTYMQFQTVAIDVSSVPNGIYKIRVTANPKGNIFETTRANNISYRTVILGGVAGKRTVRVPKYGLVDSDKNMTSPPRG